MQFAAIVAHNRHTVFFSLHLQTLEFTTKIYIHFLYDSIELQTVNCLVWNDSQFLN